MADIADIANERAALFLRASLIKQQQQAINTPSGIGICLACGDEVEGERRWCDAACRDDWQRHRERIG